MPHTSYGKMCGMAKKKRKPKKFSAVDQVKAMARAQIGAPPAGRVVPDRREKKTGQAQTDAGKDAGAGMKVYGGGNGILPSIP